MKEVIQKINENKQLHNLFGSNYLNISKWLRDILNCRAKEKLSDDWNKTYIILKSLSIKLLAFKNTELKK